MKHVNLFMKTVMENSLQIEHYWGRVEISPGRGAIHLEIVYLQDFFNASTLQEKAEVLKNYATKHLKMTADAKVCNNLNYPPDYSTSPLARPYSECSDKEENVRQLAQDCMCHECNRYCLKSTDQYTKNMQISLWDRV